MKKLSKHLNYWLLLLFPIFLGLLFLWIDKDLRPIHHDESLHALYGLYYYFDPSNLYYKYDPMLHGPLLYHLLPWIYHLLDESLNSLRVLPALLFTIIPMGVTYLFKDKLDKRFLVPAALLLSSPSFIYWGKFLRHDSLVIFLMILAGFSFLTRFKKYSSVIFISAIVLQFCTKENAYIHILFLMAFSLVDLIISKKDFLLKSVFKNDKLVLIASIIAAIFIYTYYYSGAFLYTEGILDGLYRKSLVYWSQQHSTERISGPFLTQFFVLLWYELPVLILLIFSIFKIHLKESPFYKGLPFITLLVAALFHFIYGSVIPADSVWSSLLKIKIGLDFYGFFFFLITAVSGTIILLKNKKRLCSFFYYWTFASFFTYSFLGEKVPWLSLYILFSGVIFISLYYQETKIKFVIPSLATFICFNFYQSYHLNFINTGSKKEFISQVHTSKAYQDLSQKLEKLLSSRTPRKVLALSNNTWPLSWFLYKRDGYYYFRKGDDFREYDVILDKWPTRLKIDGYKSKKIALRHWWLPDWERISWKKAFTYTLNHEPWNNPGEQFITIFYKEELLNF